MSKNQEYKQALNDDELSGVAGGQTKYKDVIHVVQQGETIQSIADRYLTTVSAIQQLNPGINLNNLKVGQRIAVRREAA